MIILIGPAGSGKSVQGQMLVDDNGWKWLSMGQLLRDEDDPEIKAMMAAGSLGSSLEMINRVLIKALDKAGDLSKVILDGYPRKTEQAEWLVSGEYGKGPDLVVVIDVGNEELFKRIKLRGRSDDTEAALVERMRLYHENIDPILDIFEKNNVKVSHVDGEGPEEQIHERIVGALKECGLE